MREWYSIENRAGGTSVVEIHGSIGRGRDGDGMRAKQFAEDWQKMLAKNPTQITLRINSPGGDVADGTAIYNAIRRERDRVTVYVDGWAASIASIVALAGSKLVMSANAMMMIHNPTTFRVGDATAMRQAADLLDKAKGLLIETYKAKSGKEEDEISAAMDKTTWFTAEEAVEFGLADEIDEELQIAAHYDPKAWAKHYGVENAVPLPETQKEAVMAEPTETKEAPKAVTIADLRNACPGADNDFLVAQLEANATTEQASKAWMQEQAKRLEAANAKAATAEEAVAKAEADKAKAKTETPGVDALGDGAGGEGEGGGDPVEMWEEAIANEMKRTPNRGKAVSNVVRKQPELHKAYVEAYNAR